MTHPNQDDGLEWLLRDMGFYESGQHNPFNSAAKEPKGLAWWKGECIRLKLAIAECQPVDRAALRWQYIVALDKVMGLERNAGMNLLGE